MELNAILTQLYKTNNLLRNEHSGLYLASLGPEYKYVWIRDVFYQVKPLLKSNPEGYIQTYRSLLDYYKGLNYKYDDKIDELIRKPFPLNNIRFIHPRFYPNLKEITGDWGNLQLDTFGYFFLGVAEGLDAGLEIIRDESDIEIINKLIKVLYKIKYWTIFDSGIWEENTELHASSIGAILSGLHALERHDFAIHQKLFDEGYKILNELLPRESCSKEVDLSLLTLVFPFNIMSSKHKIVTLDNIHKYLERERGVARYVGDKYYNINKDNLVDNEAEWTFGLTYLFFAYIDTDFEKAEEYLFKTIKLLDSKYYLPELYYSKTDKPNENNPLGWSIGMLILAIEKYLEVKLNKDSSI